MYGGNHPRPRSLASTDRTLVEASFVRIQKPARKVNFAIDPPVIFFICVTWILPKTV